MLKVLAYRIASVIPVMVSVAILVFLMLRLSPGDPAAIISGDYATPEQVESIRVRLGLNQPLHEQLLLWIGQLARGDLGTSIFSQVPVLDLILQRIEPTLMLAILSMTLSVVVGVPLGVLAAYRVGSVWDRLVELGAALSFSIPVFVLGYLLVLQFSLQWKIFPTQGYVSPSVDLLQFFRHMALPAVTLSAVYLALIVRTTRASLVGVLVEDFVRTARAKGQREWKVLFVHALKNAAMPIITVIGVGFALMIGGAVVTETVFNIPGVGRLVVDAVVRRDYPILQGVILLSAGVYILINLIIDVIYTVVDPRVRL